MNFLVDAQLPPALAQWIASQGHQAAHVVELGLQAADDGPIWEHVRLHQSVKPLNRGKKRGRSE